MELLRVRLRGCCGEDSEAVVKLIRARCGSSGRFFQFEMHLNMAEHLCRDYFPVEESSLSGRSSLQGCFFSGGIILNRGKFCAGMLFQRRNHPKSEKILRRDYFPAEESSLEGRNALRGLFFSGGIIPERKECFAGIIFQWRNHP